MPSLELTGTGRGTDVRGSRFRSPFAVLASLAYQAKVVSAWILPDGDSDRDLTLNGANVEGWAAAYGTFPINFSELVVPPQWDATLFSNKGGVTFDGTTQSLTGVSAPSSWPGATEDLFMLAAVRQDGVSADGVVRQALAYGNSITTTCRSIGRSGTVSNLAITRLHTTLITGATTFSGAHTVGGVMDIGATSAVYLDGASDGTASTATASLSLTRTRMGAGTASSAQQLWSGAIVAAAVLNSTATLQNFLDLEAEFRARLT